MGGSLLEALCSCSRALEHACTYSTYSLRSPVAGGALLLPHTLSTTQADRKARFTACGSDTDCITQASLAAS